MHSCCAIEQFCTCTHQASKFSERHHISAHRGPRSIYGRHAHKVAFQKSDLFFICVLRPLSNDIKIDETEIQAAKVRRTRRLFSVGSPSKQVSIYDLLNSEHGLQWMPLPEWMEQPFIQDDHMFRKISEICMQHLRRRYCGLTAHHVVSKFDGGTSTLYYTTSRSWSLPERGDPRLRRCGLAGL